MKIAIVTAGAAGMYCGSCLKDNTLAAALVELGHDCILIPTYTPLTLDEPDQSTHPIFLGGINVFLDEYRWSRWLPGILRRGLNSPRLLRFVTRFANTGQYDRLGDLTISMLRGEGGHQAAHFAELADHIATTIQPDVVILSNVLISGLAHAIRKRSPRLPILATLQGDDFFLDRLHEPHRQEALRLIRDNDSAIAGGIATSNAYADRMAGYLTMPRDRIHVVYPGIRTDAFDSLAGRASDGKTVDLTVGYFARIAPEKGLHRLIAALKLAKLPPFRVHISGWLGENQKTYLLQAMADFRQSFGNRVEYVACPTIEDKARFLQSLDIFSVPATFHEPKGIYVLEAMAAGVPVVQPAIGSFPELLERTGGGLLVPPDNDQSLADGLVRLAASRDWRRELGQRGRQAVRERFSAEAMARATIAVIDKVQSEATP